MDNQAAFTIMTQHLLAQGSQSREPNGIGCAYRGMDGFSCAVGILIPDELYNPDMEGEIVVSILNRYPELAKLWKNISVSLLSRMQHIHDHECPDEWETEFERAANDFHLTLE